MNKVFLAFSFCAASLLMAQTPNSDPAQTPAAAREAHQADPQKQLDHLSKKLALTADQQSQILPILNERAQQMAAIREDSSLSQKDRHQKMHALRADSESHLRAVLTDTQRAAYDQMRQDQREHARTRRETSTQ